jgi:cytochrome c biogenesis protein CcmG/thiol:disulfide interchange protein DsbE
MKRKSLIRLMAEAGLRSVRRHRVITTVIVVLAAAAVAVSLVTTGGAGVAGGAAKPADQAARAFTVTALGHPGQRVSLSQYAGRPVILNFWASWCEPCQQETPLLARWYKQHDGHVALLGLDENDSAAAALAFAQAKGVTYPLGFDPNTIVASDYDVAALPQTFFLDARHRVVDHVAGALTQAELDAGLRLMDAAG